MRTGSKPRLTKRLSFIGAGGGSGEHGRKHSDEMVVVLGPPTGRRLPHRKAAWQQPKLGPQYRWDFELPSLATDAVCVGGCDLRIRVSIVRVVTQRDAIQHKSNQL